jgi:diguanylate cyclase (GGDEF)-like protein
LTVSFFISGGIISGLISSLLVILQLDLNIDQSLYFTLGYMSLGIAMGYFFKYRHGEIIRNIEWQNQINKRVKELNIVRKISIALQSTLELDNLLYIILTSITAGYGLGFNRALLFLISDNRKYLEGKIGIGPMNEIEGYKIWENVVAAKMNLVDFINLKEEARITDHKINDKLQQIKIPLDKNGGILSGTLESKKPLIVQSLNQSDSVQEFLFKEFSMKSFAVVPLINKGKPLGLIIVDNIVNHKSITYEDLDNIVPLANQAALAIDNARLYKETQRMAITDGLTGLYNQNFFIQTLAKYIDKALENNQPLSLLIMDIDFFKNYNDTNGHLAGNKVLSKVAKIIKENIRSSDIASRFGGEEFAILFPNTNIYKALELAENIRIIIEQTYFENQQKQPKSNLTVSIGVASIHNCKKDCYQLLNAADSALYKAKRNGKNQVCVFEEGQQ